MYEPTYPPTLEGRNALLSGLRFQLKYDSDKMIRVGDDSIEPAHIHDCYEIFFNDSTEVSFLVNNRIYPVSRGEAVISGCNDVHVCIFHHSCAHSYFCLWIDAAECPPIAALLERIAKGPLLSFDAETRETVRTLLFSLRSSLCEDGRDVECAAHLLQLLTTLDRCRSSVADVAAIPELLQQILDYVNENFAEIHHINEVVEQHFVSTATLNRYFKRYLHISPREFLESKKLSHAARLLSSGSSVMDACMGSGFSECSHFIRRFKMKFGETPLKYKQRFSG